MGRRTARFQYISQIRLRGYKKVMLELGLSEALYLIHMSHYLKTRHSSPPSNLNCRVSKSISIGDGQSNPAGI